MAKTFPAKKFSGTPKNEAIKLIQILEKDKRGYFGGSAGFVGFDGTVNHAIMIHTFLSKNGELKYRAGAGLTIDANVGIEFKKVVNESMALSQAIKLAVEQWS